MRVVVFFCLMINLSLGVLAQPAPVSVEAYGKLPSKSMMVISPSEKRLAYRDTSANRDIAVIINLADSSLIAAADISAVKPNNMYFIDEDRLIFVASENRRIRGYLGRHNVSVAMAFNVKTKKIHQLLIPGLEIYKGQTSVGQILRFSADKKYAYMPTYGNPG